MQELYQPNPFAKHFSWMQEGDGGCCGRRTFPVPWTLEGWRERTG